MKNCKAILVIFVLLTILGVSQLAVADASPKGQRDAVVDKYPGNGGFPHGEESYPIGDVGNTSNGNSGGGIGNTGPGNMGNDKLVGNVGTASTGDGGNGGGKNSGGDHGGTPPDMKECPKKAQGKPCKEGSISIPPRVGNPGGGNFGNDKLVGNAREKRKCPGQHVCGGEGGGSNGSNNGGVIGGGNGGLIVQIETAGDGSGTVITDLTLQAGDRQTFYAVLRTPKGKYLRPATDVTWDIGNGGGFVIIEESSGGSGGAFITIEAQIAGSGGISMISKFGNYNCSLTIIPGQPYYIVIETKGDGTGLPLIELPSLTAGSGGIDLYNCVRDKYGNFIGTVDDAIWEYTGGSGVFTIIDGGVNFNPTKVCADCELTLSYEGLHGGGISGITVLPGEPTGFTVELTPDCDGNLYRPSEIVAGERTEFYICSRDAYGNFVSLIEDEGTFSFVYSGTEEVVTGDFGGNGNGGFYFEVYEACGCSLTIRYPDYPVYIYKTNITPNKPTQISIEDKTNGDGQPVEVLSVAPGEQVVFYAVGRDDWGNYVDNVYVNWSLSNNLGSISPTANSYYTVYQGSGAGDEELIASSGTLRSDSVALSTSIGAAYKIFIEDKPDGTGKRIRSLNMKAGDRVTLYAVTRDIDGNFTGTYNADWDFFNADGYPLGVFEPVGPTVSTVFEAQTVGDNRIRVSGGSLKDAKIPVRVQPGEAAGIDIRYKSRFSSVIKEIVGDVTMYTNDKIVMETFSADAFGNVIESVPVAWSMEGDIGGTFSIPYGSATAFTSTVEDVTGTITATHDSLGSDSTGTITSIYAVAIFPRSGAYEKLPCDITDAPLASNQRLYTVPQSCTLLQVKAWGAGGGGNNSNMYYPGPKEGGAGGYAEAVLEVTPGEALLITEGTGGKGHERYNGQENSHRSGSGGGGASSVMRGSTRLLVAGGGGGSARCGNGGAGGGEIAQSGGPYFDASGQGGSLTAPGEGGLYQGEAGQCTHGGRGRGIKARLSRVAAEGGNGDGTGGYGSNAVPDGADGVGGGGGGYFGGGGGGTVPGGGCGLGGGGGSGYAPDGGINLTGLWKVPPMTDDPDYVPGVAVGGDREDADGGPGLVVLECVSAP